MKIAVSFVTYQVGKSLKPVRIGEQTFSWGPYRIVGSFKVSVFCSAIWTMDEEI